MPIKLDKTQFPDTLNQQAQARIAKTIDDLSKRDELFASPVAVIVSTQAIKIGTSVAVWGGPAGSVLVFPPAASTPRPAPSPSRVRPRRPSTAARRSRWPAANP
jgi:hypothetical protein